jgi:hypothetical protein
MDAVMDEYISNLELGPVKEFEDMAVIPIFTEFKGPEYLTLKEALEKDLLIITEVDEAGIVGELKVKNIADIPVLILDGEEIVGAKQNRILNTTILISAGTEITVPVSCTERGRWAYKSRRFRYSDVIADHRVRRNKSYTVQQSLRKRGTYQSDQRRVWEDINQISCEAQVSSRTSALKDVYLNRESDLEEYTKAFPYQEKQKGLLVMINGKIAGLEVLSSSKAYELSHDNLIKSYALEAALNPDKDENGLEKANTFLDETRKSEESKHKSLGYGYDHRYTGDSLIGSSLIYNEQVIYGAFFKLN